MYDVRAKVESAYLIISLVQCSAVVVRPHFPLLYLEYNYLNSRNPQHILLICRHVTGGLKNTGYI